MAGAMRRLFVTRLDSIGAVEEPDNEPSKILFWKRKTTHQPDEKGKVDQRSAGSADDKETDMSFDLSALDESIRDDVQKALDEGEAATARVAELEQEDTSPVDEADPEVQAEFAKANQRIEKLEADLAKERDARTTASYIEKAKEIPSLNVEDDDDFAKAGGHLKALGEAAPESLDWMLERVAEVEAIASESELFKSLGSEDAGDATASIEALAQEKIKEAGFREDGSPKLTPAAARTLVRKERPDLKSAEREES
jgi:hypothetical protein